MPPRYPISHFSPQRTDPETLEAILVQRGGLLDTTIATLRDGILGKDRHHFLFIGPRGAGKTHLLSLVHHRLVRKQELGEKMRFAWLNEDETSTTFLKLLIRIYRDLSKRYPQEFRESDLAAVFGKEPSVAAEMLGKALLSHLGKRVIVLLIENLDALFTAMPEAEQRNWRGFIQNHPVFVTVASAQSLFSGVSRQTGPFYGFFEIKHLKSLGVDDATLLLEKIAELNGEDELVSFLHTSTGKSRIRAIHHLSGGNPRLYIILSEFLTREALDDLVGSFQQTVDKQLTAYYQERLRWISAQQQEIVQFLCQQVRPVPVKEIATGIFAKPSTVSSQLKHLKEMGYVIGNDKGRETLYELAEPLMRLSFQVKDAHGHQPLALIVDFLRVWYDRREIEGRLASLAPEDLGREYFAEALRKITSGEPNLRHEILRQILGEVNTDNCRPEDRESLYALASETNDPDDWWKCGMASMSADEPRVAVEAMSRIIENPNALALYPNAHCTRGFALFQIRSYIEAAEDFNDVIFCEGLPVDLKQSLLILAGEAYKLSNKYEDAVRVMDVLGAEQLIPPWVKAKMHVIKGGALMNLGNPDLAALEFRLAVKIADAPLATKASALVFLAVVLVQLDKDQEALGFFDQVVELSGVSKGVVGTGLLGRMTVFLRSRDIESCLINLELFVKNCSLRDVFNEEESSAGVFLGKLMVIMLADMMKRRIPWENRGVDYLSFMAREGLLSHIGEELVSRLDDLKADNLNSTALDAWSAGWHAAGDGYPEMEIPLRMLDSGIAWIKTRDEASLLELAQEERAVVRQALGLDDGDSK